MNFSDLDHAEILIIGSDNPNLYLTFVEKLAVALKAPDEVHPPKLKAKLLREARQLTEAFAEELVPALVCFDIPSLQKAKESDKSIEAYIKGVKTLDPSAFIMGLSSKIPTGPEALKWIDLGLVGWIKPDFETGELESSLKEAFSQRIKMVPRRIRVNADHRIEMKIASVEQALVAEVINLGVGGMFIRSLPPGVKAGDKVEFRLQSSTNLASSLTGGASKSNPIDDSSDDNDGTDVLLEGTALVVWVRSHPNSEGPEGIGVQFLTVDSKTHKHFEKYIGFQKMKTFIPEG